MKKTLYRAAGLALGFVLVAAFAAAVASASSTTTEQPTVYMILLPDDSVEKGKAWPKSEDECLARAKAISGSCSIRRKFITTTTCSDEKAPRIYLTQIEIDGQKAWDLPPFDWPLAPDTGYVEREWLYIHNPTWPAGYPNCWVRGWEDPALWRANPKAEPGKVFLERIEPGMTAEDVELPNDETPAPPWPSDLLATWNSEESCQRRRAAHVDRYPEDVCP